jgi:hypothetical protein
MLLVIESRVADPDPRRRTRVAIVTRLAVSTAWF